MWTLVLTAVAVAASAEGGLLYATAPQDRGQYHRINGNSYNYGYNTGDGVAKVEVKRKDGSVVGSYRYFDPTGKQIVRSYVADNKGFRILGNDLPIGPETPAAAILGAPALTASVEGAAQNIVSAAQHPTKRQNTVDIETLSTQPLLRHYQQQQAVFRQQNDLLQQQQRMIEQQQRQINELTGQTSRSTDDQFSTRVEDFANTLPVDTTINTLPSNTAEFNAIVNNVSPSDAPYYYYPYDYNYEFPAGFAYAGGVVEVVEQPKPRVIGVSGTEEERNIITAGQKEPPLAYRRPTLVVVRRNNVSYRRPYVIGRT